MKETATSWCRTPGLSDAALIERIVSDRIDILVDLAGHTSGNRLRVFTAKPAPVQLTWMGSVGTTGLAAMDGVIADRFHVPPGQEGSYVEQVFRLPESFVCFEPPAYAPAVGEAPFQRNGFITFGCFSNPAKINASLMRSWAAILQRIPDARLRLRYRWMDARANRQRIEGVFERHGIESERLIIEGELPHRGLLGAYGGIDIALDTWPYSGCATTLEALWMGCPVITRPEQRFASRHTYSVLATLGLDDLIASDAAAYVEAAARLATDRATLGNLRSALRDRLANSPLCDPAGFTKSLEAVYREAWSSRPKSSG